MKDSEAVERDRCTGDSAGNGGCVAGFPAIWDSPFWAIGDSVKAGSSALGGARAKPRDDRQKDLLRPALEDIIDLGHPLLRTDGCCNAEL